MLTFILKRLGLMVFTLWGVSVVIFIVVNMVPGDPIAGLLGPNSTPEVRAQFEEEYGFDKPLPQQYLTWLGNLLQGDLGTSIGKKQDATELIGPALKNSAILA